MSDEFLDEVLNDSVKTEEVPAEEVKAEEVKTEEVEAKESTEETGEEEKSSEVVTPTAKDEAKEQAGLLAALMDEREKRQALQKQIEEINSQKPPEKDFFEDPEGHLMKLREELEAKTANRFVDLTVSLARRNHEDFDEVMTGWKDVVEANPALLQQVMNSENPGEESYQIAKSYRDMQSIGDPAAFRAKLEQEVRDKLKEELKAEILKEVGTRALPQSLASERNVGDRKGPEWSGPPSLDDVLGT